MRLGSMTVWISAGLRAVPALASNLVTDAIQVACRDEMENVQAEGANVSSQDMAEMSKAVGKLKGHYSKIFVWAH